MRYTNNIRSFFISITIIVLGTTCLIRIGTIDFYSMCSTVMILIPAIIIMGYLGEKIGRILDNPKNRADADYKISVLNALKKMDKSITLQELNEKLTKQVAETDIPDITDDVDE